MCSHLVSTKTELLKQVDQLVIERDELALEVILTTHSRRSSILLSSQNGELHTALEQEKSKNKHLTQELSKFQVSVIVQLYWIMFLTLHV